MDSGHIFRKALRFGEYRHKPRAVHYKPGMVYNFFHRYTVDCRIYHMIPAQRVRHPIRIVKMLIGLHKIIDGATGVI